jgi:hypothetical protein
MTQDLKNKIAFMGWTKYFNLSIHEKINAKSVFNGLNVNYIMTKAMDGVRLCERDYSRPQIYSRACKQWWEMIYHK